MADRLSAADVAARSERNRKAWYDVRDKSPTRADRQVAKPARERSQRVPRASLEPSEHQIQVALLQWWDMWAPTKGLDKRLLMAVPNGGGRSKAEGGRLKAEGVRAGYPDLVLDLPLMSGERVVFHGAKFELKAKKGRTSPEQRSYHDLLIRQNYMVLVVWGYDEAVRALTAYVERALKS